MNPPSTADYTKEALKGTAVTSLLVLGSAHLPFFGAFLSLLLPLVVLYYRAKLGRFFGSALLILSVLVDAALLSGSQVQSLYVTGLLCLGWMMGEVIARNLSVEKTILYPSFAVVLGTGFLLFLYCNMSQIPLHDLLSDWISKYFEYLREINEKVGMQDGETEAVLASMDQIRDGLVGIFPSLLSVFTILVCWINLLAAKPLLQAKHLFFPDFGALHCWKAPDPMVWAVIACAAMMFLPGSLLAMVGANGLVILMVGYFLQGMAVVSFWFERKRLPMILKVFFYTTVAFQQVVMLLVIAVGFFDIWINFRRIGISKSA